MRVIEIGLKNFRSYQDAVIPLGDRTLVIGVNGSGKSTLIDAIAWVLTGRCRGVDGKGQGQKELIRTGADQMEVTLVTDILGTISRSLHRAGSAVCSMKPEAIQAKLGVSADMLLAVLYGQSFFQMDHAAAKKLLMGLLDVTVKPADVPSLDLKRPITLDELEAKYQAAYADRAGLKKTVGSLAASITPFTVDPKLASLDPEKTKTAQVVSMKAWEKAVKEQGTADTAVDVRESRAAGLRQLIESKPKLEGQKQAHEETRDGHSESLAAARVQLAAVEDERAEAVDTLQATAQELKLGISKLERHDPERGCVLAASIPCLTAATEFVGHIGDLRKQVKDLDTRIKAGTKRAETLAQLRQKVKDEERQRDYHQNQVDRIQNTLDQVATAAADLAALQLDIQTAKDDQAQLAAAVEAARQQMDQDASLHRQVADYIAAADRHVADTKTLAARQAELAAAEEACDLLGPKGIRVQVLTKALGDFEGLINAALEGFGFTLSIQVEPFDVLITVRGQAPRPYELLSAGEQLWCGLAFQLALAIVSGLNMVALDTAEAVVGQNRAMLTDLVMHNPVAQVVVAMAKGESEPDPNVDGLTVIRLAGQADAAAVGA